MGRIKVLDPETAEKIAAGEVVERPASVVKELVENSLDAGSTRISVEIKGGGLELIRVTDNGCGIEQEDVRLAFQSHATSKISAAEDLERVTSYGFRGEALPSIAAVARVTVVTRPPEQEYAWRLVIAGGEILEEGVAGGPPGTTVTVADLFFNTPARRKFMKDPRGEKALIHDVLIRLALSRPEVAYLATSEGKKFLQTGGSGDLRAVWAEIFGAEAARKMYPFSFQQGEMRAYGLAGAPEAGRPSRRWQYFCVNGRPVRDPHLRGAVEEAYRNLLTAGDYPAIFLNLEIPPEAVDVNVHPAKTEVRLQQPQEVRRFLTGELRRFLLAEVLPRPLLQVPARRTVPEEKREEPTEKKEETGRRDTFFPLVREKGAVSSGYELGAQLHLLYEQARREEKQAKGEKLPPLTLLGQVEKTYLVATGPGGLYLIDQHAAHERILYEKIAANDGSGSSQALLLPVQVELTPGEEEILRREEEDLVAKGFRVEPFGGRQYLIREAPAWVPAGRERDVLLGFLAAREGEGGPRDVSREELTRQTMACRGAIKAGQVLTLPEMESLLSALSRTENPYTCPHGRPTVICLGVEELEKRFKRGG